MHQIDGRELVATNKGCYSSTPIVRINYFPLTHKYWQRWEIDECHILNETRFEILIQIERVPHLITLEQRAASNLRQNQVHFWLMNEARFYDYFTTLHKAYNEHSSIGLALNLKMFIHLENDSLHIELGRTYFEWQLPKHVDQILFDSLFILYWIVVDISAQHDIQAIKTNQPQCLFLPIRMQFASIHPE